MAKTAYSDSGYFSAKEETLNALADREGYAVLLGAAENTVKLPTTAAEAAQCIGVLWKRYDGNNQEVTVQLFNKEGSFVGKMAGVVAKGAPVKVANDGRFETGTETDKVGRYIGQDSTAANDLSQIVTV